MKHLFNGQMEFPDEDALEQFLQTINITESIQLMDIGLEQGIKNGAFGAQEVVVLYNCLKKIKAYLSESEGIY